MTNPDRLSRDREAAIRRAAFALLAALLAPGAAPTQRMVAAGWPDAAVRAARVACDVYECHGVRAAALAALSAAAAVDPDALAVAEPAAEEQQGVVAAAEEGDEAAAAAEAAAPGALRRLHRLGLAALLQHQQLWEALPPLLGSAASNGNGAPPALAAAAAGLVAQALAADPAGVGLRVLLGGASWEGPDPALVRPLVAALPPCGGGGGTGGAIPATGSEVDVPAALLAVVNAGLGAQRRWAPIIGRSSSRSGGGIGSIGAGLPEACAAQARALEWLAAADASPSEDVAPSTVHTRAWVEADTGSGRAPISIGEGARAGVARWQAQAAGAAAAALQALTLACAAAPSARAGGSAPEAWAEGPGPSAAQIAALKASAALALRQLPAALASGLCAVARALPALADADAAGDGDGSGGAPLEALRLGQQQIGAARGAAQALAALLARKDAAARLRTVRGLAAMEQHDSSSSSRSADGADSGSGSGGSVLSAAAAILQHALCDDATAEQLAALVGCLLADEHCARALLRGGAVGERSEDGPPGADTSSSGGDADAEPLSAGGEPVGAALCAAVARLVPSSFFIEDAREEEEEEEEAEQQQAAAESGDAGGADASGARDQQPGGSSGGGAELGAADGRHTPGQVACLVALRNLVAYGRSAKVAALEIGLPAALLDSCGLLAAQLAAAPAPVPPTARPRLGVVGGARADTAAPDSATSKRGASAGRPPSSATGRGAAAAANNSSSTPFSLRRPGLRRLGQRPASSARPCADADKAALDAAVAAAAAAEDERQQRLREQRAQKERRQRAAARLAAARERRLLLCLALLRHVAFRDPAAKEALVEAGLLRVVTAQLWPVALQRPAVLSELLELLASLAAGSEAARLALASPAAPRAAPALALVLQALNAGAAAGDGGSGGGAGGGVLPDAFPAAARALLHFASAPDGAAILAHPSSGVAADAQRLLRSHLGARDFGRAAVALRLLAAVAACPEGQRALLRPAAAPALLDAAVAAVQAPHEGAVAAALLLVHNLSFSADVRAPALANRQLLPLLLAAAESLQPDALMRQGGQLQQQGWPALGAGRSRTPSAGPQTATAAGPAPGALPPAPGRERRPDFVLIGRGGKQGGANALGSTAATDAAESAAAFAGGNGGTASGARLQVGGNACAAAYAAGALWALAYGGEAAKAAVRRLPHAAERLAAARAHCALLLRGARGDNGERAGSWGAQGAAAVAAAAAAAVRIEPASAGLDPSIGISGSGGSGGDGDDEDAVAAAEQRAWWLERLEEGLRAVTELLQQPAAPAAAT